MEVWRERRTASDDETAASKSKTQRPLSICSPDLSANTVPSVPTHPRTVTMYVRICVEMYTLSYECSLSVLICVCSCCLGFTSSPSISERFALTKMKSRSEPQTETCSHSKYPDSFAATSDIAHIFVALNY